MRDCIESIEYKGYKINIYQDDGYESPRDWDNLGKMICWHKRYNLGDTDILNQYIMLDDGNEVKVKDLTDYCNGWDEVKDILTKHFEAVIILPLFLYDHSGLSLKTYSHGQHASWDGGYIGFILTTKKDILKWFIKKNLTKELIKRAEKNLLAEIECYDNYLSGNVYGYKIEKINDEEARGEFDGVWGFYGDFNNRDESNLLDDAESAIEYEIKQDKEKQSIAKLAIA